MPTSSASELLCEAHGGVHAGQMTMPGSSHLCLFLFIGEELCKAIQVLCHSVWMQCHCTNWAAQIFHFTLLQASCILPGKEMELESCSSALLPPRQVVLSHALQRHSLTVTPDGGELDSVWLACLANPREYHLEMLQGILS